MKTKNHDIKIKPHFLARFPDICIVCEQGCQEYNSVSGQYPYSSWPLWLLVRRIFYPTKKVEIPCHKACIKRLRIKTFSKKLVLSLLLLLWLVVAIYFDLSRLMAYAVLFSGIICIAFWEESNRLPFEYYDYGDFEIYSFTSEKYAKKFESLNKTIIE